MTLQRRGSSVDSRCPGPSSIIIGEVQSAKNQGLSLQKVPNFASGPPRRRDPPRTRVGTREHTYATPRSAVGVCDHFHAHGSRTRTAPDHTSHQPVTGQRSTALTVIFSRQPPSRLGQPTEPRGGHTRSLLRTAVGHCSLGHAHRPHGVGALADSALSRPSWAAFLARRSRLCDNV